MLYFSFIFNFLIIIIFVVIQAVGKETRAAQCRDQ